MESIMIRPVSAMVSSMVSIVVSVIPVRMGFVGEIVVVARPPIIPVIVIKRVAVISGVLVEIIVGIRAAALFDAACEHQRCKQEHLPYHEHIIPRIA